MVTYPQDWEEKRLLDCVSLVQGLTYRPENVKSYGTLVLRSSNIKDHRLALDDNVYVDMPIDPEKIIQDKDILVCVRNGSAALIGKSCVLKRMPNTTFGAFMSVLRGDQSGYIAKIFESDIVQSQVRDKSSATINQITKKDFESIKIVIPSLRAEQKDVANTLSLFDTYIDDLAELIEKKKGIRNGALEDLIGGRTRLDGFDKEWVVYPFKQYFSLLPSNTYSRDQLTDRGEVGDIHYGDVLIKYGNVLSDNDDIPRLKDASKIKSRSYLQMHDVLIADTAEDETVGKVVQIGKVSISIVGGLHTVACRPNYDTAEGFLGYYMNSTHYQDQLYPYITGIKVSSVSKKSFGETELRIPSDIGEQKTIVAILTIMDQEIEALETERDKMIQIREGAMDDLLTGRVRLTV